MHHAWSVLTAQTDGTTDILQPMALFIWHNTKTLASFPVTPPAVTLLTDHTSHLLLHPSIHPSSSCDARRSVHLCWDPLLLTWDQGFKGLSEIGSSHFLQHRHRHICFLTHSDVFISFAGSGLMLFHLCVFHQTMGICELNISRNSNELHLYSGLSYFLPFFMVYYLNTVLCNSRWSLRLQISKIRTKPCSHNHVFPCFISIRKHFIHCSHFLFLQTRICFLNLVHSFLSSKASLLFATFNSVILYQIAP